MTARRGFLTDLDRTVCRGCGHRRVQHPHGDRCGATLRTGGVRVACPCRGFADGRWHVDKPSRFPDGRRFVSGDDAVAGVLATVGPDTHPYVRLNVTMPSGRRFTASPATILEMMADTATTTKDER